jgi:branched-chain amino acid aminotransferase
MKGYSQILWLVGSQHNVSEVGTMNMFFYWVNKETGKKELITAPLDGTILPGITRMSVLELCRDWNEFQVSERTYTIYDVLDAIKDGRMIEAFGAGTAAVVSPVNRIAFEDKDYAIPLDKDDKNAKAGKLARRIWDTLTNIQYGRKQYKNWSRVVD